MNTQSLPKPSVVHTCDFCKKHGVLNQTIFNHAGWYYCQKCLVEMDRISKVIRQKIQQPSLF